MISDSCFVRLQASWPALAWHAAIYVLSSAKKQARRLSLAARAKITIITQTFADSRNFSLLLAVKKRASKAVLHPTSTPTCHSQETPCKATPSRQTCDAHSVRVRRRLRARSPPTPYRYAKVARKAHAHAACIPIRLPTHPCPEGFLQPDCMISRLPLQQKKEITSKY